MLEREDNDEQIKIIWREVLAMARTDAEALDIFYNQWIVDGLIMCDNCGSKNINRADGCRTGNCNNCGVKIWVTSGTLLNRASKFQAYLGASLIREAGLVISGAAFARLTDIHTSTAYNIERKFNLAVCDQIPEDAAQISGRLVQLTIAKRSRQTPAGMHPFTEQRLIEEQEPGGVDFASNGTNAEAVAANSENFVPDNCHDADTVRPVVVLQLSDLGLTEQAASIGLMANEFANMIVEYFHRVGRKGIQQYFGRLWCLLDRVRWGKGSIVSLCAKHRPISYNTMLNYISPPLLKIVLC